MDTECGRSVKQNAYRRGEGLKNCVVSTKWVNSRWRQVVQEDARPRRA